MVRELGRHHRRCKGAALDTLWLLISVSFLCFSFCRLSLFLYMDFVLVFRGERRPGLRLGNFYRCFHGIEGTLGFAPGSTRYGGWGSTTWIGVRTSFGSDKFSCSIAAGGRFLGTLVEPLRGASIGRPRHKLQMVEEGQEISKTELNLQVYGNVRIVVLVAKFVKMAHHPAS